MSNKELNQFAKQVAKLEILSQKPNITLEEKQRIEVEILKIFKKIKPNEIDLFDEKIQEILLDYSKKN